VNNDAGGEKTERPTPKKIRDARKKGQVARSQEVVSASTLFASLAFLWWNWGGFMGQMTALMDIMALIATDNPGASLIDAIALTFGAIARALAPLLLVVIVFGVFSNYFQFGSVFSGETIKPKIENIGFKKGFKRIFSKRQLVELLKSVIKIVFLTALLYVVIRSYVGASLGVLSCGLPCLAEIAVQMLKAIFLCAAFAFATIALADFFYQRRAHTKSLMMSKHEIKREHKENEGDPLLKSHRKNLAFELIMNENVANARKATAVVVNPTHFAVAIQYDEERFRLPMITAKGRNLNAVLIRAEAEKAGVPVFLNVQLARSLYATVEIGEFVPDELFRPVAEILVWVRRNKDLLYQGPLATGVIDMQRGDHRNGTDSQPPAPADQNAEATDVRKT
jgi:type III secretion protein U